MLKSENTGDIVIISAISLTLTGLELLYSPIFSFVMTLITLVLVHTYSDTMQSMNGNQE